MPATIDEDLVPDIRQVIFRKCAHDWEAPEEKLSNCNLTYLVEGDARFTVNNETYDLTQGALLFLPPNYVRKGSTCPERLMHCFSVDFDLHHSGNRKALSLPFPVCSHPGRHDDIVHMFHDLAYAWLGNQPGYNIKSRGLFMQIIHRFLELVVFKNEFCCADDPRINRVIRYMEAHYPEHITVKMMAKMAGLNPTYFGHLFRQEMGLSFNRCLINIRVRNAENMLTSGEFKVGQIADACGFTDMSHFYKQYKLIKGFPPSHSLPKKF